MILSKASQQTLGIYEPAGSSACLVQNWLIVLNFVFLGMNSERKQKKSRFKAAALKRLFFDMTNDYSASCSESAIFFMLSPSLPAMVMATNFSPLTMIRVATRVPLISK